MEEAEVYSEDPTDINLASLKLDTELLEDMLRDPSLVSRIRLIRTMGTHGWTLRKVWGLTGEPCAMRRLIPGLAENSIRFPKLSVLQLNQTSQSAQRYRL